jgi:hypothetical protein
MALFFCPNGHVLRTYLWTSRGIYIQEGFDFRRKTQWSQGLSMALLRPSIMQKCIVLGCCHAVFSRGPQLEKVRRILAKPPLKISVTSRFVALPPFPNIGDDNLSLTMVNASEIQKLGHRSLADVLRSELISGLPEWAVSRVGRLE